MNNSELRQMYEIELVSIGTIAQRVGKSRTWIHHILKSIGVDTSKRPREVKCLYCGKTLLKTRSQIRKSKNHFCNHKEYLKLLREDSEFDKHRLGQRIGKTVFQACTGNLDFDPVIHHVDGDQENNKPKNIWAFRTPEDHIYYHRGGKVKTLKADTGAWEEVKND